MYIYVYIYIEREKYIKKWIDGYKIDMYIYI